MGNGKRKGGSGVRVPAVAAVQEALGHVAVLKQSVRQIVQMKNRQWQIQSILFFLFISMSRTSCAARLTLQSCRSKGALYTVWHATYAFGHVTVSWAAIQGFCFLKTTFKSRRSSPVPARQQDFVFLWHLANMAGELCSPEPSSLPHAAAFCVPCAPWSPRWQPVGQEAEIRGVWTIKPPFLSSSGSSCRLSSSSASHVCLSVGLSVSSWN